MAQDALLSFLTPSYSCHTIGASEFYVVSLITFINDLAATKGVIPDCHQLGLSVLSVRSRSFACNPNNNSVQRTKVEANYVNTCLGEQAAVSRYLVMLPIWRSLEACAPSLVSITAARLLKRVQADIRI